MFLKRLMHRCFASKTTRQLTQMILDNLQIKTTSCSDVIDNADIGQTNDTVYINTGNTVYRADGKPLTDEDIKYLIASEASQARSDVQNQPSNPHDEELSYEFFSRNHLKLQQIENRLIDINQQAKIFKDDIDKKIELCNTAINLFYDIKKICSHSEGGKLYFAETWEHCFSSQKKDFCFIEETEKLLEDLQLNYDDYDAYFRGLKTLKNDLIKFIIANPGFLQKDIYSHFHPRMKSDIQSYIRLLEKEGCISRTKKGNTYILDIKK